MLGFTRGNDLEPGPIIGGLTGSTGSKVEIEASMHSMFHGWTFEPKCYGSTGMPTDADVTNMIAGKGFTGISTWAVNLNERLNCVTNNNSLISYLGPGINADNLAEIVTLNLNQLDILAHFIQVRIKVAGEQIVKMFKIPVNELRQMGALLPVVGV
jgi:hypothetical protein